MKSDPSRCSGFRLRAPASLTPAKRLNFIGDALISLWDSWDAIKAFAGPEYENAVYYPEDEKFLVERGPRVIHYEVLAGPTRGT